MSVAQMAPDARSSPALPGGPALFECSPARFLRVSEDTRADSQRSTQPQAKSSNASAALERRRRIETSREPRHSRKRPPLRRCFILASRQRLDNGIRLPLRSQYPPLTWRATLSGGSNCQDHAKAVGSTAAAERAAYRAAFLQPRNRNRVSRVPRAPAATTTTSDGGVASLASFPSSRNSKRYLLRTLSLAQPQPTSSLRFRGDPFRFDGGVSVCSLLYFSFESGAALRRLGSVAGKASAAAA
ncbi:hypothetical protein MRX96_027022 [Rhipicephalus microplus]